MMPKISKRFLSKIK